MKTTSLIFSVTAKAKSSIFNRARSIPAAISIACFLFANPANAAVIINFDSLPGMIDVPGTVAPPMSQLSNQLISTTGAAFSSALALNR